MRIHLFPASCLIGITFCVGALSTFQPQQDWSNVRVYLGPKLIANPAALTPNQLADAVILKPRYSFVYCVETGDVREAEDLFPYACKDIRREQG